MSDTQPVEQPAQPAEQPAEPSEPARPAEQPAERPAFFVFARAHNIIMYNDGLSHRNEFRWQLAGLASGRLELRDGLLHEREIN